MQHVKTRYLNSEAYGYKLSDVVLIRKNLLPISSKMCKARSRLSMEQNLYYISSLYLRCNSKIFLSLYGPRHSVAECLLTNLLSGLQPYHPFTRERCTLLKLF